MHSARKALHSTFAGVVALGLAAGGSTTAALEDLHQHVVESFSLVHAHAHLGEHHHHDLQERAWESSSEGHRPAPTERPPLRRRAGDHGHDRNGEAPRSGDSSEAPPACTFSSIGVSSIAPLDCSPAFSPELIGRRAPLRADESALERSPVRRIRSRAPPEPSVVST